MPRLQGDLASPAYFDFISFAQYATTSQEIPRGKQASPPFLQYWAMLLEALLLAAGTLAASRQCLAAKCGRFGMTALWLIAGV